MRPTDAARTETSRHRLAGRHIVSRGLVPAAVLAGSLGATAAAGASTPQSVVTTAKVAGLGTILEASNRPLYVMASDPKGRTTCMGGCTKIWKPLIVKGNQVHKLGHVSGLGTIHRSNKQLQVAIHGHALYRFVNDHSKSQAVGQAFLNNWFTVKANGTLNRTTSSGTIVTAPPTSQPAPSPSTTTTTRPPAAPASPPPTAPPPPPTTSPPPTTTTTTSGGDGGVGF